MEESGLCAENKMAAIGGVAISRDPWHHRGSNMRCASCMWFVTKAASGKHEIDARGDLGRCRRHAPTMSGFPAVFQADWCGDHKLDETKI